MLHGYMAVNTRVYCIMEKRICVLRVSIGSLLLYQLYKGLSLSYSHYYVVKSLSSL